MEKETQNYTLRDIDKEKWIEFQVVCKREGTTAAEKLRTLIYAVAFNSKK